LKRSFALLLRCAQVRAQDRAGDEIGEVEAEGIVGVCCERLEIRSWGLDKLFGEVNIAWMSGRDRMMGVYDISCENHVYYKHALIMRQ